MDKKRLSRNGRRTIYKPNRNPPKYSYTRTLDLSRGGKKRPKQLTRTWGAGVLRRTCEAPSEEGGDALSLSLPPSNNKKKRRIGRRNPDDAWLVEYRTVHTVRASAACRLLQGRERDGDRDRDPEAPNSNPKSKPKKRKYPGKLEMRRGANIAANRFAPVGE